MVCALNLICANYMDIQVIHAIDMSYKMQHWVLTLSTKVTLLLYISPSMLPFFVLVQSPPAWIYSDIDVSY